MSLSALFIVALTLSFDAFGASVSRGAAARDRRPVAAARAALLFGAFAFAAPLLGWAVGKAFYDIVQAFDHWIAFILLAGVGVKMIHDGVRDAPSAEIAPGYRIMVLLASATATSIDAAVVGFGLPFLRVDVIEAAAVIGGVTMVAAYAGGRVGAHGGHALGPWAEVAGGVILIAIGLKVLVTHLAA